MGRPQNTLEKFWRQIDKNGPIPPKQPELGQCWIWTGFRNPDGYGVYTLRYRSMTCHRWIYELCVGPLNEIQVLHKCDNPACCRPDHLFEGNHSINMQDMWNKNRHVRPSGARNNHAKLTEGQVLEIRSRRKESGATVKQLAKEFGVTAANIGAIARRCTWKFI